MHSELKALTAHLVMPGVPEHFNHPEDHAEFCRKKFRPGVELYRAHIVHHAFDPHVHEGYGVGVIEQGTERFQCAGSDWIAPAGSLVLMNPDVLHNGHAETESGWQYHMLYITPEALGEVVHQPSWYFPDSVAYPGAKPSQQMLDLLKSLWSCNDALTFDGLLHQFMLLSGRWAQMPPSKQSTTAHRFDSVIDYMHAHLSNRIRLEDLSTLLDLSPFHFLRCFRRHFHASPHETLMALRLHKAKQLLANGMPPSHVATDVGLSDQSHLTKAFSKRYGTTPARYQQQVRR